MKVKTPILVKTNGGYWDKDLHFGLCDEFAQQALRLEKTEVFRLVISTKKLKDALKGNFFNEDDEIYFSSNNVIFDHDEEYNYVDFYPSTEDWILKNFPGLREKNASIKVWVKVKSYGVVR